MELFSINSGQILVAILVTLNIFSFVVMARDKHRALDKQNTKRIPEGLIFFLATIFGSLGVYLGMFIFRHKTRKWYFQFGIPLLIFQNLATIYLVWKIIRES
jgi:uncharacterized membrane protein YsdA (DUF1294 family)